MTYEYCSKTDGCVEQPGHIGDCSIDVHSTERAVAHSRHCRACDNGRSCHVCPEYQRLVVLIATEMGLSGGL